MKPALILIFLIIISVLGFLVFKYILSVMPIADKVAIGGAGGIFKSVDQGENWTQLSVAKEKGESGNIKISDLNIYDIEISPQDSQIIFAGTSGNGLIKSVNGGVSWKKVGKGALVAGSDVVSIAIDPKNPQNIYLATYSGDRGRVLKSVDLGENFKEVFITNTDKAKVLQVEIDNYDNSFVFIATSDGLFLGSKDFGESWQNIRDFEKAIVKFVLNPKDTREVYVSLGKNGLFSTADKGTTWNDLGLKLSEKMKKIYSMYNIGEIKEISIDSQSSKIFIGAESKILSSGDKGENFEEIKSFPAGTDFQLSVISIDFFDSLKIYIGGGSQIYKSIDGGSQWRVKKLNSKKNISVFKIDPANPTVLYVGFGK